MDDDDAIDRRAKFVAPLSPELRARIIDKFRKLVGGYVRPEDLERDSHDEWRELHEPGDG
jgi:hypothetical protein